METELRIIKSQMIFKHEHLFILLIVEFEEVKKENELTRESRVKRKVADAGDIPDAVLIFPFIQSMMFTSRRFIMNHCNNIGISSCVVIVVIVTIVIIQCSNDYNHSTGFKIFFV